MSENTKKPFDKAKAYSRKPNAHQGTQPKHTDGKSAFSPKGKSDRTNQKPFGKKPFDRGNANPHAAQGRPQGTSFGKPFSKGADGKPSGARPFHASPKGQRSESVTVSPARRIAYSVLCDVYEKGAYAALSLNRFLQEAVLREDDRRLATALVYGVIEKEGHLNYLLAQFLHAPLNDRRQRIILQLGVYQLLFMDRVPDNAAVNESVNLCKAVGMPDSAGFINAVLRSLLRGKETLQQPSREPDLEAYLSIMSSAPQWLVHKLCEDYGQAVAEQLLTAQEESRCLVIRPNFTMLTDAELEKKMTEKQWHWKKGLVPHAYCINGADIARSKEFAAGQISIQGQSSMLAAMAMDAKPGMKILDACAAPGGKSAYLCEVMQLAGRVYSWELHEARVALLRGTMKRLHLDNMRAARQNALILREDWIGTLDGVLLDAPCSGTGVMSQKPDIKHRLQEDALPEIIDTQKRLLDTVCQYVKRGGTLVYSTCSVLKDENERQVARFLQDHPEFAIESLPASIPAEIARQQTPCGLQLLSGELEGFFIARMRRVR